MPDADGDKCSWPRCRADRSLVWLEQPLCWKHWCKVCELTDSRPAAEVLARVFGRKAKNDVQQSADS